MYFFLRAIGKNCKIAKKEVCIQQISNELHKSGESSIGPRIVEKTKARRKNMLDNRGRLLHYNAIHWSPLSIDVMSWEAALTLDLEKKVHKGHQN